MSEESRKIKFTLDFIRIDDHPTDEDSVNLVLKPKEGVSTYEYRVDRLWMIERLREILDRLYPISDREIREALRQLGDRLK